MTRVLITGAAGFIGSHVVEHLLKNTDWEIVILDKLTYASRGLDRLMDIGVVKQLVVGNPFQQRVEFHAVDISKPITVGVVKEIGDVDYIIHMAAETHVDNSIKDPWPFVEANVVGTFHMLEFARQLHSLRLFVYFSTDEVFGPAAQDLALEDMSRFNCNKWREYREWDRYNSTNPYSATKAAGEELCLAWSNTYGIPMVITHTMNNFGERQHPEKFIPKVVRSILKGDLITVHADASKQQSGSRFYIHCRNTASAILHLLHEPGSSFGHTTTYRDKFNIVGEAEVTNLALVHLIGRQLSEVMKSEYKPRVQMVDFHSSRPGHDLRYALDGSKMAKLGWQPPVTFEESLKKTVEWMVAPQNIKWLLANEEVGVGK